MNKIACLIAIAQVVSAPNATAETKEIPKFSPPLGGTTPSKTLNARLNSTTDYKFIPVVTAKKLYIDYNANEAAADMDYKGKPYILRGVVSKISKNFTDNTYLSFWGDQYGIKSVDAYLFQEQICSDGGKQTICSAEHRASKIKKKDSITLECFGAAMLVQHPQAVRCLVAP